MFKLAGECIYNIFPSDKYGTLQKVLQAETDTGCLSTNLESFLWEHVYSKVLSSIFYYYYTQVYERTFHFYDDILEKTSKEQTSNSGIKF